MEAATEFLYRVHETNERHVHVGLFVKTEGTTTFAKSGHLVFDLDQWVAFQTTIHASPFEGAVVRFDVGPIQ